MRKFNTSGPCVAARHYMIDPVSRLPDARGMIDDGLYFIVHAPRQTGKTTTLRALAKLLMATGDFVAVHLSLEMGQAFGDDIGAAERAILRQWRDELKDQVPADLRPDPWPESAPGAGFSSALSAWARDAPRPLVLFLDEIDALRDHVLISILRQLRVGFPSRPTGFPSSVVLCGLRDIRDYKVLSHGPGAHLGTASPFNVSAESERIADFTEHDLRALYAQHTADTGQVFEEEALARAWELTGGQPWLTNALAREIIEKISVPLGEPITRAHMEYAKERMILARATHLDSLVAKLREPRVRRVIEPILAGELPRPGNGYNDDVEYARDLGLITPSSPLAIANPIYREVILRVLAAWAEDSIVTDPRSFVQPDGCLDIGRIYDEFADFWRQHGDIITVGVEYHEVAPQLVLLAFLQRVVNGGGYVQREVGVGSGRIDGYLRWPFEVAGKRQWQEEIFELKVWRNKRRDPLLEGLKQLERYLGQLGKREGTLVIFDRRQQAAPVEKRTVFEKAVTPEHGYAVRVLRA